MIWKCWQAIEDSIVEKSKTLKMHILFYDTVDKKILNFNMSGKYERWKILQIFSEFTKNDLSYTFAKYHYKIYIKAI